MKAHKRFTLVRSHNKKKRGWNNRYVGGGSRQTRLEPGRRRLGNSCFMRHRPAARGAELADLRHRGTAARTRYSHDLDHLTGLGFLAATVFADPVYLERMARGRK